MSLPSAGLALTVGLVVAVGYLLGSIPFGLLLLRVVGGPDPRGIGSGNIGATNVTRAGGKGLGLVTLLLDAGKGAAAVLLASEESPLVGPGTSAVLPVVAGLAAVIGHCYPIWLRFRGGKGVATFLGVAAVVLGWPGVACFLLVWLAVFLVTRIAGAASLAATWTTALVGAPLVLTGTLGEMEEWWLERELGLPARQAAAIAVVFVAAAAIVTLRHRTNIAAMSVRWRARSGQAAS